MKESWGLHKLMCINSLEKEHKLIVQVVSQTCPYVHHCSEQKVSILERKVVSPERTSTGIWAMDIGQDAAWHQGADCVLWAKWQPRDVILKLMCMFLKVT